jgi:predicted RNA binding protein YcfA (HicA-like mRNA interferase family)
VLLASKLKLRQDVEREGSVRSREVLKLLREEGWVELRQSGSDVQLEHPGRKGLTTVPHPKADLPLGTLKSIERQSGVKLRGR